MKEIIDKIKERVAFTEELASESGNTILIYEVVGMKKILAMIENNENK